MSHLHHVTEKEVIDMVSCCATYQYTFVICVAYGCDSRTGNSISPVVKFHTDPKRKKMWTDSLNRGQTATKKCVPKSCSRLCMKHFLEDQNSINPKLAESIGYKLQSNCSC